MSKIHLSPTDFISDYKPAPTALAFINSTAKIKGITGPIGGGKTVACVWDLLYRGMRQPPGRDGVRRYRVGIVRSTYANLVRTTVKTLRDWLPPMLFDLRETPPMEGVFTIPDLGDGTSLQFELVGLSLGHENALNDLKSLEVSAFWLQEAGELEYEILQEVLGRVGRYPPPNKGVLCAEPGVVMDFNLYNEDHWLYKLFESKSLTPTVEDAEGNVIEQTVGYFKQPPAAFCINLDAALAGVEDPRYRLNAEAENLNNLDPAYYSTALMSTDFSRIQRNILMLWTKQYKGKRIHVSFSRDAHVAAQKTQTYPNLTCLMGIDTSGLHPAAVFAQPQAGVLVITDEAYGDSVPFLTFVNQMVLPVLATRFPGCPIIAICDPSNPRDARSGITPIQTLQQVGIQAIPAPTNKFAVRVDAGERMLRQRNALLIDPGCTMLIDALETYYVRPKLKGSSSVAGSEIYADKAEDNKWTHIADAYQYLALHFARGNEFIGTSMNQTIDVKVRARRFI